MQAMQTMQAMHTMQLVLRNEVGEIDAMVVCLEKIALQWNIPAKARMEIHLVLEELFSNVVLYAFMDEKEHFIVFDFTLLNPNLLQIRMEDDGKPFNLLEQDISDSFDLPVEERKIGGLGIHFIRELTNSISYQRSGDKNIVILTKTF